MVLVEMPPQPVSLEASPAGLDQPARGCAFSLKQPDALAGWPSEWEACK